MTPVGRHRYEPILPISRSAAEAALAGNDPGALHLAVLAVALHDPDPVFATVYCAQLADHADPTVRGNAILGLGHIARIHGTVPLANLDDLLTKALADRAEYVRGQAAAAADDVAHFLSRRVFD
jgi:hypothetical protein